MASNSKQPQSLTGDIVTALRSVNSKGVVFLSSKRIKICSEIKLTVETTSLGFTQEWTVQGCVVECRAQRGSDSALRYQITLLFSSLPAELRAMLAMEGNAAAHLYPAVAGAVLFGLN